MSTDRGEPEPQEWPTYPGLPNDAQGPSSAPQPEPPRSSEAPASRPYAEPDPPTPSFPGYAQQPGGHHAPLQPHQAPYQHRRDQGQAWLRDKWLWIAGGLVAVFLITGLARGDFPWMAVIFGIVVWNILRHKRRQG